MPRKTSLLIGISGAVAGVLVGTACGVRPSGHADAAAGSVRSTIAIQPGITFAPPPTNAAPRRTAEQVFADYERRLGAPRVDWAIPAKVSVELGLFTLAIGKGSNGKEAYTAHNVLAYGYSSHSCPASRNPRVKKLPPNPCREWDFLNANTGAQILQTWQANF
jgi:hypothetical protein